MSTSSVHSNNEDLVQRTVHDVISSKVDSIIPYIKSRCWQNMEFKEVKEVNLKNFKMGF